MTLIDKAKLLNTIATEVHYDSEHSLEMYAKMLSLINDAPAVETVPLEDYKSMERTVNKMTKAIADAEPVVRCKDCKWHYLFDGHNRCDLLDLVAHDIKPDWFCADGERREDAKTN